MTQGQRFKIWLAGLAAALVFLYLLRGVLLPFVAGMALAFFLDPLADRLERAGLSRTAATATITGVFFLLVVTLAVLLLPILQEQVVAFVQRIPTYVDTLNERLHPLILELKRKLSKGDIDKLRTSVGDHAGEAVTWLLGVAKGLLTGGLAVINVLSLLFITPIVTFYMLRDWDIMVAKVDSWLPREHRETIRQQAAEINRTLAGFLRGQASVCLALGAFYGIGLSLVGLDLGLVIGLGAGLISFVPYLGTITGFVTGMGLALAQSQSWELPAMVAAVFAAGQLLEGNFLTPKLVGDKVGLHPVWIMFALLAGGGLFGFVGLLLAVPIAAVIGVLSRSALKRYLRSSLYHGHMP
ncbi:AI-2E family transporter [Magnetospirillum sulfuroxidans]|uniref:AI-2E family transporter n=1 Tax=Magnetospirillum sulfuroxidans TaxID=611300 RepID=A0ABS5ICR6_9PROT|nr:AI-2E family transporter [Magnetospirillum sulfuroxidans]MBR9972208.1 AI-2E family transporter [Magnetospirillum sulfuroxidans]